MDITDEWAQAWRQALEMAGFDAEKIIETCKRIAEAIGILVEEAVGAFNFLSGWLEERLEELEKRGVFDYEPTARKKKRERDRRMAVKMAHVARFSRYDNRRLCRAVKRRTKPRARERGPPVGGQAAIHREKE